MEIDYGEVRSVARRLRTISSNVKSVANGRLRQIEQNTSLYLEGRTADALENAANDLRQDITRLANGLSQLSQELFNYAYRLQQADEAASSNISNR